MDETSKSKVAASAPLKATCAHQRLPMASYALIGAVLVILSGCLSTSGVGTNLEGRIDRWVAAQEYGKALVAIDSVDKKSPHYHSIQKKRNSVSAQVKEYEDNVIKSGKKEMRRNDWGAVLDRYDVALKKLPKSQRLIAEYNNILTKQKIKIHKAEQKVLFAKGEMLEKEISYNHELAQVDPRNLSIIETLKNKTEEARKVSDELLVFVEVELERKALNKAKNMASLAYRLHPSEKAGALKSRVIASIKLRNDKKNADLKNAQKKKMRKAKQRAQALMSDFNGYLSHDHYSDAKKTLVLLKKNTWQAPGLDEMEARLQEKLANHVDHQLELGYSYYKRESYQKALDIWQGALKLQPNHKQAREYVERVQKVIKKLEALQSKSDA
jgi:tetratricopeptide (TPR) repeat protein